MSEPTAKPAVTPDYIVDTDEDELKTDGAAYQGDKPANQEQNRSHGNTFWYGQSDDDDDDD